MKLSDNDIVDILTGEEQPPDWFVRNILVQGSFGCLVGESGAGKSNIAYLIAMAVASGMPALSGLIPKGPPKRVLYFDDENSVPDRNKYLRRAWQGLKAHNRREPSLKLLQQNLWVFGGALGGEDWDDIVERLVTQLVPEGLFFDTANACFGIDEENSNSEAGKIIRRIKQLQKLVDPVALAFIIKHAKTRTEAGQIRTVRGAKIWKDQSDWFLFQVKAGGRPRKDGLSLTRLVSDKKRAYGLERPIYITPSYTDAARTGLVLEGSHQSSREHTVAEDADDNVGDNLEKAKKSKWD